MKQPTCPKKELYLGIKDCLDCKKYFFESFTLCSRKEKRALMESLSPSLEYDEEYLGSIKKFKGIDKDLDEILKKYGDD